MTDIRDKIRKLLAMAEHEGGNDHERQRAMSLASELMMRHGIERDQIGGEKPKVARGDKFNMDYDWYRDAANAAATLYGCRAVFWANTHFTFVGREDNRGAAQDTMAFLVLQVEAAYRASLPKGLSKTERADYRRSFKRTASNRLWQRAQEAVAQQAKAPSAGGTALVLHMGQLIAEVDEALKEMGTRTARSRKSYSGSGTMAGWNAANAMDLNRPVGAEERRAISHT